MQHKSNLHSVENSLNTKMHNIKIITYTNTAPVGKTGAVLRVVRPEGAYSRCRFKPHVQSRTLKTHIQSKYSGYTFLYSCGVMP